MQSRSPVLVSRYSELQTIRDSLTAASLGQGGSVFLVGESGIGKTRLAAEAAQQAYEANMVLMRGRGSAIRPTAPFWALTEALLTLLRDEAVIDVTALGPYQPVLARLVPDWGPPAAEPGSLVILAEAVLRLTALAGEGRGCLVSLDDLQDADAETLTIIDYLVDNLDQQPTLFLGAIRNEDCPALELAHLAARRGKAVVIELDRLDRASVGDLAAAALSTPEVSELVVDLLWAGSDGNPLLVEELLSEIVDAGLLVPSDTGWRMFEAPVVDLPDTLARTVARRVAALKPATQNLLAIGAVTGKRFPLAVVQSVTGLPDQDVLSQLHEAPAAQLIRPDDTLPRWFTFHHQLLREAAVAMLAPKERARLAGEVADAIERGFPGLPGEWCHTAATLRLEADAPVPAGRLFAEAGRRALEQGAIGSAVALLDKAWHLLAHGDPAERAEALENLVYALAEAGLGDRALTSLGMFDQIGGLDPRRRAKLHTRLAWAAEVIGPAANTAAQIDKARVLLGPDADEAATAEVDVVEAHALLDQPGPGQVDRALALAQRAAEVADRVPLPVVACQAWQLLGWLHRLTDTEMATTCLEHAREIAVRYNLPIWEIRALVRLGNDDALRHARLDRLEQVRTQADLVGAVHARYQAEQSLAFYRILEGEFAAAEALLNEVFPAVSRLKLVECVHYVLNSRAILAAHQGRRTDMDAAITELESWGGHDLPIYRDRIHGLARVYCALLEENRSLALEEQETALRGSGGDLPTTALGRYGMNLLLAALAATIDRADFEAAASEPAAGLRWDRMFAWFGRAVLVGRAGHADEATAAVTEAVTVGSPYSMGRHLGLRLVAEAALADGWGNPVDWLQAAEHYFHRSSIPAVARACHELVRGTGAQVAQRQARAGGMPSALREVGVTPREYEVLLLLCDRLSNREIAGHLQISHRTVENHVSSSIMKTGLSDRFALASYVTNLTRL